MATIKQNYTINALHVITKVNAQISVDFNTGESLDEPINIPTFINLATILTDGGKAGHQGFILPREVIQKFNKVPETKNIVAKKINNNWYTENASIVINDIAPIFSNHTRDITNIATSLLPDDFKNKNLHDIGWKVNGNAPASSYDLNSRIPNGYLLENDEILTTYEVLNREYDLLKENNESSRMYDPSNYRNAKTLSYFLAKRYTTNSVHNQFKRTMLGSFILVDSNEISLPITQLLQFSIHNEDTTISPLDLYSTENKLDIIPNYQTKLNDELLEVLTTYKQDDPDKRFNNKTIVNTKGMNNILTQSTRTIDALLNHVGIKQTNVLNAQQAINNQIAKKTDIKQAIDDIFK